MSSEDEQPLYINTEAMLSSKASAEACGIMLSLVAGVWMPTMEPFLWDPDALAARIPGPGISAEVLEAHRDEIATFFVILPDGRWAPSPEYWSATDGNREGAH